MAYFQASFSSWPIGRRKKYKRKVLYVQLTKRSFQLSFLFFFLCLGHVSWFGRFPAFLACVCLLSHFSHVQLCATLWILACQAPLLVGFSRQVSWSGLSCPPAGDLPDPGIEPASLMSPASAGGFFTTSDTWDAPF